MLPRRALAPAAALLAAVALAACTPGPIAPAPTPTDLLTDDVVAGAEAAFRAYVDALNQIDVADPATFEPAFALTTGRLNEQDRQTYSQWHADQWVESGDLSIASMSSDVGDSVNPDLVTLNVCLDSSDVRLVDSAGVSQVNPARQDRQPIVVSVDRSADSAGWLVERITISKADLTC